LIQGIVSTKHEKELYKKLRKRGGILLMILVFSSLAIFTYNSISFSFVNEEFDNYSIKMDLRTVISGTKSWEVALIRFRYIDETNHYYLLLHRNGILELAKNQGSKITVITLIDTNLSPFSWHNFEIHLKEPYIQVFVDGTQYLDEIDYSLSKGRVCLKGFQNAILTFFKNVEVEPLR
jgi:hypothetical protein